MLPAIAFVGVHGHGQRQHHCCLLMFVFTMSSAVPSLSLLVVTSSFFGTGDLMVVATSSSIIVDLHLAAVVGHRLVAVDVQGSITKHLLVDSLFRCFDAPIFECWLGSVLDCFVHDRVNERLFLSTARL